LWVKSIKKETGITNSKSNAEVQSPQDFQGKHFNHKNEAVSENLFYIQPLKDFRTYYTNKSYNSSLLSREKAYFQKNFKSSRSIDQEYRRNPAIIEKQANVIEVPQRSGDRFKFEYITKNFSKEMNHNIIRLLEFREKLFTIRSFDILNFMKSINTIEIHEIVPKPVEYNYYIDLYVYICRGIIGRTMYIISKVQNRSSRDLMIKEVLSTIQFSNSIKLPDRKGALEMVFIQFAIIRNKVIKQGKNANTNMENYLN
jgi:hypothetical protein